jgi:ornithine carbamoyltransferase
MLNHHCLWSLDGLTRADMLALVDCARTLKRAAQRDGVPRLLRDKHVALLSDDHSSPAATAFQRAATELGAQVARVRATDPGLPDRRDPRDTAGLLGQLYDAIECEGLSDSQVLQLDLCAGVPVYNGIGRLDHPTRVIADLMTLQEFSGQPLEQMHLHFAGELSSPAGRAVAKVAAEVGAELEPASAGCSPSRAGREEQAAVIEAARAVAVCSPGEGGRLPLRLLTAGDASAQAMLHAQRANQRHVLQALLVATMA